MTTTFDPTRITVTNGEWCISYNDASDTDYVELRVFTIDHDAVNEWGGKGVAVYHRDHHGRRFPIYTSRRAAMDAAREYAHKNGLIRYWKEQT